MSADKFEPVPAFQWVRVGCGDGPDFGELCWIRMVTPRYGFVSYASATHKGPNSWQIEGSGYASNVTHWSQIPEPVDDSHLLIIDECKGVTPELIEKMKANIRGHEKEKAESVYLPELSDGAKDAIESVKASMREHEDKVNLACITGQGAPPPPGLVFKPKHRHHKAGEFFALQDKVGDLKSRVTQSLARGTDAHALIRELQARIDEQVLYFRSLGEQQHALEAKVEAHDGNLDHMTAQIDELDSVVCKLLDRIKILEVQQSTTPAPVASAMRNAAMGVIDRSRLEALESNLDKLDKRTRYAVIADPDPDPYEPEHLTPLHRETAKGPRISGVKVEPVITSLVCPSCGENLHKADCLVQIAHDMAERSFRPFGADPKAYRRPTCRCTTNPMGINVAGGRVTCIQCGLELPGT